MKRAIALLLILLLPFAHAEAALTMGVYEQDADDQNGPEPIEWLVLDERDGMKLLISRYGLDAMAFHDTLRDVTWADSSLREWLNGTFLDAAFTDDERAAIVEVALDNPSNPEHGTQGGGETTDRIFLLSSAEAAQYFPGDADRLVEATPAAVAHGAIVVEGRCMWWLRTMGANPQDAAIVMPGGGQASCGLSVRQPLACVRPAMWVRGE